ncbi:MAG: VWA domain-containing protein, partial [Planctomycetota bacterium]
MNALLESATGLFMLDPWLLLSALLIPAGFAWHRFRGSPSIRFAPGIFIGRSFQPPPPGNGIRSTEQACFAPWPVPWRMRFLWLPQAFHMIGLVLLVFALARPVHRVPVPYETEGMDILLCLDTSSSMTATDMDRQRSRLAVARDAAARFIEGRTHDRIGLLCFARFPDLRCPLTLDHRALKILLADVTTVESDSPEDATGIGTAVARAAQVIRASPSPSKVLILLTDGEENVALAQTPDEIAPVHAAQLCRELGVRVYTIAAGIGTPDPQGHWMPIDTRQVRHLAERTGGCFYEARDAGAIAGVYADIDELEKVELEEPRYKV